MDFESTPDLASDTGFDGSATPDSGRSTGTNTPKPALKSTSSFLDDDDDTNNSNSNSSNNNSNSNKKNNNGLKQKAAKKPKKNRTLKWDEAKIQEHDQLRGTRMKIDEPNTPFAHYDSGSETDCSLSSAKGNTNASHKISWDALTNKLEAHAAVRDQYPPSSPSSHGETLGNSSDGGGHTTDEEDEDQKRERQRQEMKRLQFQELRKRHYNEMEVVRRFQRDHPDGVPTLNGHGGSNNSDDDEDNDGDDENE